MSSQPAIWPASGTDELETPFAFEPLVLDVPAAPASAEHSPAAAPGSPFVREYFDGEETVSAGPEQEAFVELLDQLFEPEFDEVALELVDDARGALAERAAGEALDPAVAEQFLEAYLTPLREAAEHTLEAIGQALSERDLGAIGERELDELFDRLGAREEGLAPVFEDFLGGIVDKLKSGVKTALATVGGIPMALLMPRIKALAPRLIRHVLRFALDRINPKLRPLAEQLARRLLGGGGAKGELEFGEAEDDAEAGDEQEAGQPATADIGVIQQQLDLELATLLAPADPAEAEIAEAQLVADAERGDDDALAALREARQRFIRDVTELEDGADATPLIQEFAPAIVAVLKTVGPSIARAVLPRVVEPAIRRYVGREKSRALAKALVDAGLKAMMLEAPPEAEREAAGAVLAATVEDTLRELSELDEAVLGDEELLEAYAYDAFEAAAAANFPPATLKPELRPTATLAGTFVAKPLTGQKLYKKYSASPETTITPQIARRIRTFGGRALEDFLRDERGVRGTIKARAHIYEAIAGTSVAQIALHEHDVPGLGRSSPRGAAQIHPLTREAAGLLFREPGLGSDAGAQRLSRGQLAVGQRLVYLELLDAPPPPPGRTRRATRASVTLNFPGRRIRLDLYFSEHDAQRLAARANRGGSPADLVRDVRAVVAGALGRALAGNAPRGVRMVHEDQLPRSDHRSRRRVGAFATLRPRLIAWLTKALLGSPQFARDFSAAAASDRDGVRVIVTFEGISGLDVLGRIARGRFPAGARSRRLGDPARTTVSVVGGRRR
jgi:hypothetical protein